MYKRNYRKKANNKDINNETNYKFINYPHRLEGIREPRNSNHVNIVSIDPGSTCMGFCIETRFNNSNKDDFMFYDNIKTIESETFSFENTTQNNVNIELLGLFNFLNKYRTYYDNLDIVIIEEQLSVSPNNCRIMSYCISYFSMIFFGLKHKPVIILLNSHVKGKYMGLPKQTKRKILKKSSYEKVLNLLNIRGDELFNIFNNKARTQIIDQCDAIVQIEACFWLLKLPLTHER